MLNGVIAQTIKYIIVIVNIISDNIAQPDDKIQKVTYGEGDEEVLDDKFVYILLYVLVSTYDQNEDIEDHSNEGKTMREYVEALTYNVD